MPKLKESPQQRFYNQLTKDIQKQMIEMGYSRNDVAERACMKYNTLCKRINQPDTWVMSELVTVMTVLKMDLGGWYGIKAS